MRILLGIVAFGVITSACGRTEVESGASGSGGFLGGTGGKVPLEGAGGTCFRSGGGGAPGGDCSQRGPAPTGVRLDATTSGPLVGTYGPYTGHWYTVSDANEGGGSAVCPSCTEEACAPRLWNLCAAGLAGRAFGPTYSTAWGAGLGWSLNQPVTPPTCVGGTPGVVDLTGKTINATIQTPPTAFRIYLDTGSATDNLCLDISNKTSLSVRADTFLDQCWSSGTHTPITPAQLASVQRLKFVVPTNTKFDVPFAFCITSLTID